MTFLKDLSVGCFAENLVRAELEKMGASCVSAKNNPEYDLDVSYISIDFKIEVKYDKYAEKSGNMAIEFYNSKSCKNSGINITSADIWACVLSSPDRIYITKVDRLKKYIKTIIPIKTVTNAGDGNACIMLYPLNRILEEIFLPLTEGNLSDLIVPF